MKLFDSEITKTTEPKKTQRRNMNQNRTAIASLIRAVPNFPKPGILFRDVSPLLTSPEALRGAVKIMAAEWKGEADMIAGLDARGFIFGALLARELSLPFLMIRKKGKLPGPTESVSYDLEYGQDTLEISTDVLPPGKRVLIVDDLLATGGTALAACSLVEKVGLKVAGCTFVIGLDELTGKQKLKGYKISCLLNY